MPGRDDVPRDEPRAGRHGPENPEAGEPATPPEPRSPRLRAGVDVSLVVLALGGAAVTAFVGQYFVAVVLIVVAVFVAVDLTWLRHRRPGARSEPETREPPAVGERQRR